MVLRLTLEHNPEFALFQFDLIWAQKRGANVREAGWLLVPSAHAMVI